MDDLDIYDYSKLMKFEGNFDTQVANLLSKIRLTRQEVNEIDQLFEDLRFALNTLWNGCLIYPFGSIVTGMGIKTSDVDCFIEVPGGLVEPSANYVRQAKKILHRYPQIFQQLFAIPYAKVPILKLYHVTTNRNCDLSFDSPAGVQNSKLLAYLLHLDRRLLPLAVLIKYWSKVHNLTGTNYMPNYTLILLLIFFLQTKKMMPTIHRLQQSVEPFMVDDWNTAFGDLQYKSSNKDPLYVLLGEFFTFYKGFDYDKQIICPYLGYPLSRVAFEKLDTVPREFSLYKSNLRQKYCRPLKMDTFMVVQDPFNHSRNCSVAVYPRLGIHIVNYFNAASQVYEAATEASFLHAILQIKPVEMAPKPKHVPNRITKHKPRNNMKIKRHAHNLNQMVGQYNKIKRKFTR